MRTGPVRGGRYEVKTATMVDLIHLAYGYDNDKILGGPNWLEMDRFDVIAKVPPRIESGNTEADAAALLEERFKLAVHKEDKPLPTYALVQGKKHQLKETTGSESGGCKPQSRATGEGGGRLMMGNGDGTTTMIALGPGMTVQYSCRNMTMEAFVSNLRSMVGANAGSNPIREETGLKGGWDFDLKYSLTFNGMLAGGGGDVERISFFDAVEKQLGLKLEQRQVPTPVLLVDKVNRKPTANAADLAEALPPVPMPTEFDVASVKPAAESGSGPRMMRYQTQPGGRFLVEGMPLHFLISRAFNVNNNDSVAGVPKFADTDRYDIVAKAQTPGGAQLDMDAISPLVRALLVERFKMKYHSEDRQVNAYALASAKPKLKKADPDSRSWCRNLPAPSGAPPGTRVFSCQNVTMDEFAERMQGMTQELSWPVANATGLEGRWDFTLTFSMGMPMMAQGAGRGGAEGSRRWRADAFGL